MTTVWDEGAAANAVGAVMRVLNGEDLSGDSSTMKPVVAKVGARGTKTAGAYSGEAYSGEYGIERGMGDGHGGIDFQTPNGVTLRSPFSGTVTHAGNDDPGGYGSWVEITGDDGVAVRYGHLSGVNVEPGQRVEAGGAIGLSGGARGAEGAGNSTGPHLHFEVRVGGQNVDPTPYLAGGWRIW